jgi:hypothetical protein
MHVLRYFTTALLLFRPFSLFHSSLTSKADDEQTLMRCSFVNVNTGEEGFLFYRFDGQLSNTI